MAEAITVALADHWRVYLEGLIRDRRFQSLDEAIESGLQLLEINERGGASLACLLGEGERDGGFEEWDYDSFRSEMRRRDDDREAA